MRKLHETCLYKYETINEYKEHRNEMVNDGYEPVSCEYVTIGRELLEVRAEYRKEC